jgi:hypothetical protein
MMNVTSKPLVFEVQKTAYKTGQTVIAAVAIATSPAFDLAGPAAARRRGPANLTNSNLWQE